MKPIILLPIWFHVCLTPSLTTCSCRLYVICEKAVFSITGNVSGIQRKTMCRLKTRTNIVTHLVYDDDDDKNIDH